MWDQVSNEKKNHYIAQSKYVSNKYIHYFLFRLVTTKKGKNI
jgi:hypothetical protein